MSKNAMFLTDVQTGKRYNVSRGCIWRWSKKNPNFPKPVYFSKGCVRWSISELEEFERKQSAK